MNTTTQAPPRFPPLLAVWMLRAAGKKGVLFSLVGAGAVFALGFFTLYVIQRVLEAAPLPLAVKHHSADISLTVVTLAFAPATVVTLILPWSYVCSGSLMTWKSAILEFPFALRRFCYTAAISFRFSLPALLPAFFMAFLFVGFGRKTDSPLLFYTLAVCCMCVCGVAIHRASPLIFAPLLGVVLSLAPYPALQECHAIAGRSRIGLIAWFAAGTALIIIAARMSYWVLLGASLIAVLLWGAKLVAILLPAEPSVQLDSPQPFIITRAYVVDAEEEDLGQSSR